MKDNILSILAFILPWHIFSEHKWYREASGGRWFRLRRNRTIRSKSITGRSNRSLKASNVTWWTDNIKDFTNGTFNLKTIGLEKLDEEDYTTKQYKRYKTLKKII